MKRFLQVLLLSLAIETSGYGANAPVVKVSLKCEYEAASTQQVKLADIADVYAPAKVSEKVRSVVICTAPIPGRFRTLESSYIRNKVAATCGETPVKMTGAERVKITGKCVKVSSEEIADEAKNFVLDQLPKDNRTYDITIQRPPRELILSDGEDLVLRPRILTSTVRPGPCTVAVDAVVNGRTAATTSATLDIRAVADVLVTTSSISQGEAITLSNTTWDQRDVTRSPGAITMGEGGEIKEWVANRTLSAGSMITTSDVKLIPVVKNGDKVTITVKCGNVTLRTTGQSKQDGRIGDSIQVKSEISQQDIRARITAPGTVEIDR